MENELKLGIYRHYKGPLYLFLGVAEYNNRRTPALYLGVAQHSETEQLFNVMVARDHRMYIQDAAGRVVTGEKFAVYVPLYSNHSGAAMSVRPLSMFTEVVELEEVSVQRFTFVGGMMP